MSAILVCCPVDQLIRLEELQRHFRFINMVEMFVGDILQKISEVVHRSVSVHLSGQSTVEFRGTVVIYLFLVNVATW